MDRNDTIVNTGHDTDKNVHPLKKKYHSRVFSWGCGGLVIFFILLSGTNYLYNVLIPSKARRALPESASHIQEYFSGGWNSDFLRLIKAKLPKEDYEKYAESLGLTKHFDESKNGKKLRALLNMLFGGDQDWWDPPDASKTTYYDYVKERDYIEALKYSNGTIYYFATSW